MKGRAEYENVREKTLFEDESPSSLFPWASSASDRRRGILVGERGIGKTFFIRKLSEEVPAETYQLDKKTLEYKLFEKSSNPKLIAVDDLHYLTAVMRLGYLEGSPRITEEEVIGALKDLDEKAKRKHKKILYVSDEGPSGLSFNFSDEKNKLEFAKLLKGCTVTPDDSNFFYRCFNQIFPIEVNAFEFRKYMSEKLALKLKEEFRVEEVPILCPTVEITEKKEEIKEDRWGREYEKIYVRNALVLRDWKVASRYRGRKKYGARMFDEFGVLVPRKGMETIMGKCLKEESNPFRKHSYYIFYYKGERKVLNWKPYEIKEWMYLEVKENPRLITTIRGLRVLDDVYHGLNRKSLDIDFGKLTSKGWFYTFNELPRLKRIVERKYSEASKVLYKDMYSLIKELLSAGTEKEFRAILLRDRLSKE